jgi:hypothetical protein
VIYLITYQLNNEQRILEWVVPEGWGPAAIGQSFEQQFPSTEILRIEAQP